MSSHSVIYKRCSISVDIEHNLPVPMRDGIILRADVYRPRDAGPLPVLLLRIPYDKRVAQSYCYETPIWYARQGYIVVVQDTRGRFASDGVFEPLITESSDGFDTISWCRGLPGGDGRVGTFGFSYAGANQLLAALEHPPGLAAACPGFYLTSMYEGFGYVGGAFALSTMAQWYALIGGNAAARLDTAEGEAELAAADAVLGQWSSRHPVSAIPLIRPNKVLPFTMPFLSRPAPVEGEPDLETASLNTSLPCLHISGWYDSFVPQTLGTFVRMCAAGDAEQRLLVGPWHHLPWSSQVGEVDYGPQCGKRMIDEAQIAFFNAHLKDDRAELDALPMVKIFVLGSERWEKHTSWPPVDAREALLFLRGGGGANTAYGDGKLARAAPDEAEPPDHFIYNPLNPVPSIGGHATGWPGTPTGPCDQRNVEARNDVLCYTTEPFEEEIEIAGPIKLELYAATSVIDTDFTAKICHVNREGKSTNLCEGIIRGRYAFNRHKPMLLVPGKAYRFEIDIGSTCAAFAPGEKLRLQISSSDYPTFDRNPNTGATLGAESGEMPPALQTIFHDPEHASCLRLMLRKPGDTAG